MASRGRVAAGALQRGMAHCLAHVQLRPRFMSIGRRRPKLARANLRAPDTSALKEGRLAKQRTRAVLLALVAVSVVTSAAIVHGTGPPFTYRIGERAGREIRVNVKGF